MGRISLALLVGAVLMGSNFQGLQVAYALSVPEICKQENGKNILKCPRTCRRACEDADFFLTKVNGKRVYDVPCAKIRAMEKVN